ncbi:MAG: endolytic transglycosylase MltG, partial [Candidatus Omnitrophica bacterium]|nr:endolytic transglycosylase MltG [Candidatus Omnitrophota bacterium]
MPGIKEIEIKKTWFLPIFLSVLVTGWLVIKAITLPPLLSEAKLIEVPERSTAQEIAMLLKRENIIKNAGWFLFWTKRWQVQNKLQAGIYEFSGRTSLKTVIRKLVGGQIALIKITVPEGSTTRDIGQILEKKRITLQADFQGYAESRKLEGFLFPDTYFFPVKVSVET